MGTTTTTAGAGLRAPSQRDDGRTDRVLLASPLLAGLPEDVARDLLPAFRLRVLRTGEAVFGEGSAEPALFVLVAGRVEARAASGPHPHLLAVHDPGDVFGEMSVFDPVPHTTAAVAMVPSCVAAVGRADLLAWSRRHPGLDEHLLGLLAGRARRSYLLTRDLVFLDARARVARALLALRDRYDDGGVVRHDLTQRQVAEMAGVTRETANKVLSGFVLRSWLALHPGGFEVLDLVELRRRAHLGLR